MVSRSLAQPTADPALGMTMEEFIRRFDQDGAFEIIDGEIISRMASVAGHTELIKQLFMALMRAELAGVGFVYSEATFIIADRPDWVKGARIPDLMFVSAAKMKAYRESTPDWQIKPFILVPDLVIEVVSPTDTYSDVQGRVERYLNDGVRAVWVFDPARKAVDVHPADGSPYTLSGDSTLEDAALLPGWSLALKDVFADAGQP
jgi:Uma2 family endonuclease